MILNGFFPGELDVTAALPGHLIRKGISRGLKDAHLLEEFQASRQAGGLANFCQGACLVPLRYTLRQL